MNYYIQGDAANAEQIRVAFEKLGYDTSFVQKLSASDSHILFTLPCDTRVHAFHTAYIEADILKRLVNIDPDYKELELLVEPKFKVGDEVVWTEPKGDKPTESVKIIQLIDEDQLYRVDMGNGIGHISYDMQDYYKLVPKPHYDIKNFHAGMPVLVRDSEEFKWLYTIFGIYNKDNKIYPFVVVDMCGYTQCIPYDGNEHLLGTTNMCDKRFINW